MTGGRVILPGIACPFLPEDAPIPPRGPLRGPKILKGPKKHQALFRNHAPRKKPPHREGAFLFRNRIYSDFFSGFASDLFAFLFTEPCRNLRKSLLAGSTRVVLSFREPSYTSRLFKNA